jgi:hypothetical protein
MMQDQANPLTEALKERLVDIHAAAEPSWWPPAPGWWLVGAIGLALLLLSGAWAFKRLRVQMRRRRLLRELDSLPANYDPQARPAEYLGALNRVFRVIALRAFPGTDCARLEGEAWVAFLRERHPRDESSSLQVLESGPYRTAPEFDPAELHSMARQWVARYG